MHNAHYKDTKTLYQPESERSYKDMKNCFRAGLEGHILHKGSSCLVCYEFN